ncbi:MAG: NAD(P)-dependent glycerol-3-phosphate dehydrogenase [Dehalococcoidia bacterium]|nr:NAD(P)-dependent glycerol-3-phosphate dehydrogenase [Dehalococcoidia bacterium]
MQKVTIVGNTSWGNTIAALMARAGNDTRLVTRSEQETRILAESDPVYCPTHDVVEAFSGVRYVVWVVPSQTMRANAAALRGRFDAGVCHVSAAKGLDAESGERMTQVLQSALMGDSIRGVCALSGPNLATEIARGLPAAAVVACADSELAREVSSLFCSDRFVTVPSDDIIGVELAGALKNVVALGAGMMDGLSLGDNAKAAFIAFAWSEVISIGVALGARESTFYGLAGFGDVVATCVSDLSRNHHVGFEVARGRGLDDVLGTMHHVAEGVYTARAVNELMGRLGIEAPIMKSICRVLFDGSPLTREVVRFTGQVQRAC